MTSENVDWVRLNNSMNDHMLSSRKRHRIEAPNKLIKQVEQKSDIRESILYQI